MDVSSKYLQHAVEEIASLPGIGKKTALRLALHLLKRTKSEVEHFSGSIAQMKEHIQFCQKCGNISDEEKCGICSNPRRDPQVVCVVEDLRDVMAIEATQQFNGLYHVLGGVISPMDGIGPGDLNIASLLSRIEDDKVNEVILALSVTMEGDTTGFYLYKKIHQLGIEVSSIARGVSIGDELQYTDELTLGRSIIQRRPYEQV
ncbi:MAG: recombination protein RecR [Crocinitomicaceae bacterium]|nr:recombination protein RecR [Crocinitomicaceae bacterium]|tara:strand:- start:1872 stop:2480 length:609 start_codon:yes stop_codon:yes gene_type:complete